MNAVFLDFSRDFYDKHWVYCLQARLAKRNVATQYINERTFSAALNRLRAAAPDLILYSAFSFDVATYTRFDREAKQVVNAVSILGGAGPTYDWRCIEGSTIDALCIGEGERALDEFIESGFTGGDNILLRGQEGPPRLAPWVDLDETPMPNRDIVYSVDRVVAGMNARQFLSGRGCPYACTYCFNHAFRKMFAGCGPVVRKKSVDYLLDEIEYVKKRHPFTTLVFQDDTFIVDRAWFLEFCSRFPARIGLPYTCNVRANLMDAEVAQALKDSGCAAVNWSIESGNDALRDEVLKRNMRREQILEAGRILNANGIRNRIGNLIGLPGETWEQMLETLELNIAVKPTLGLANIFVPFPGLELTRYAIEHGHFSPDTAGPLPHDYFTRSVLNFSGDLKTRLQKLHALFPIFVRFPSLYRRHWLRNTLMSLPRPFLRVIHEIGYVWTFASLYRVRIPWRLRRAMLARYIRNLKPLKLD